MIDPEADEETVAVKVTLAFSSEVKEDELTVVVVAAAAVVMVWVRVALLVSSVSLPP